ncbi:hypothetical protein BC629DRAFT_1597966 [Irpex lacteus]|nr:hypothetical protein BC629DRAFT_1597966 [Irpex lacteus]
MSLHFLSKPPLHIQTATARTIRARFLSSSPSTSSPKYPFPTHPHPTPHQIFHLPPSASQRDIKHRCTLRTRKALPPRRTRPLHLLFNPNPNSDRNAQFQAIKQAYDILRGHSRSHAHLRQRPDDVWNDRVYEELERRRRGAAGPGGPRRTASMDLNAESESEKWKDQALIGVGVALLALALVQTTFFISSAPEQIENRHRTAASNLAEARREAREFGMERRREIRRRVQEIKEKEKEQLEGVGEEGEVN